mgnify:CR=1 FL=1
MSERAEAPARTAGNAAVVIATRESRLALWQAEHVRRLLQTRLGLAAELLGMTTRGDQILDRALSKVGGKGLFVKELEAALEDGRAQLAVHSLKDVPMELPAGFVLGAVLEREDARDAFVSPRFERLDALPQGACVGTSSLRRAAQLLSLRPDLRIESLRGNLDTRLRKLDAGAYDAIVLALTALHPPTFEWTNPCGCPCDDPSPSPFSPLPSSPPVETTRATPTSSSRPRNRSPAGSPRARDLAKSSMVGAPPSRSTSSPWVRSSSPARRIPAWRPIRRSA